MVKPLKKTKGKKNSNLRQKTLANLIVENRGTKPISSLMAKAGYSHSYCKNPYQLIGTETWQEIMAIYFPDDMIAEKHIELLNAEILLTRNVYYKLKDSEILEMFNSRGYQVVDIKKFMTNCTVTYFAPDNANRKGTLELVNKLKGTYAPEKHNFGFTTGLENMSDEDLDRALKDKEFLINRYQQYGKTINKSESPEKAERITEEETADEPVRNSKTGVQKVKRIVPKLSGKNPVKEKLKKSVSPRRKNKSAAKR